MANLPYIHILTVKTQYNHKYPREHAIELGRDVTHAEQCTPAEADLMLNAVMARLEAKGWTYHTESGLFEKGDWYADVYQLTN